MHPEVEYLIELLRRNREDGQGCALLIGAGCSVTAGIPTANEIVRAIGDKYKPEYERAAAKGRATYPGCMAELPIHYRRKLIDGYIAKARVNWAHIHIARLVMAGVIDRVLTTNFDPLLVRACALFNHFPPVYDMAMMTGFQPQRLPRDGSAIFHLHGTRDGFVQAHDDREVQAMRAKLTPLFQHCRERPRTWIVVGYSGACDPVFEQLLAVPQYDLNLYWADYGTSKSADVAALVDDEQRRAYWIPGQDADNFFATLAEELDCPAPLFLARPFTHLGQTLENIVGMRDDDKDEQKALLPPEIDPRPRIRRAIECVEPHSLCRADAGPPTEPEPAAPAPPPTNQPEPPNGGKPASAVAAAMMRLLAKDWSGVLALADRLLAEGGQTAERLLGSAKNGAAKVAMEAAREAGLNGQRRAELWAEAETLLRDAAEFAQVRHFALNNWGNLLADQAKACPDPDQAEQLRQDAAGKYRDAFSVKPDMHEALFNWGNLLADQATACDDPGRRDALWQDAAAKYDSAVAIKPDNHQALNNWGLVLANQARVCDDPGRRDTLWQDAAAKYERAVAIKTDAHQALYNWGLVLADMSRVCDDPGRRDTLWQDATAKYEGAIAIKPDMHQALVNWGNILADQAEACDDPRRRDNLWQDATAKYESAIAIKPDDHQALYNRSTLLMKQAAASPDQREALLNEAEVLLGRVNGIVPGEGDYDLACIAALRSDEETCRRWLESSLAHGKLPDRSHLETDTDLALVRDRDWFKALLEQAAAIPAAG